MAGVYDEHHYPLPKEFVSLVVVRTNRANLNPGHPTTDGRLLVGIVHSGLVRAVRDA
jgi:hypothetical protein